MTEKKKLLEERDSLQSLKSLIEVYEEIAAMKMRRVKKSVLQNRDFLSGLGDLYQRVMYTYRIYTLRLKKKKRAGLGNLLVTNGKTISILLSANVGLYGEIIRRTFKLFLDNVRNMDTDILIIGKVGKQMYDEMGNRKEYAFMPLSDASTDEAQLNKIMNYILKYTNIIVYHGIFTSVLSQDPTKTFVTGQTYIFNEKEVEKMKCIVEPTIIDVAQFFEKQILSSVFEQTIYESDLSKCASRMISLDLANENISLMVKKVDFSMLKQKHRLLNSKQIGALCGISLW